MTNVTKLRELADRLERGEKLDDQELFSLFRSRDSRDLIPNWMCWRDFGTKLDSALVLHNEVLPGWFWRVAKVAPESYEAAVFRNWSDAKRAFAPTPAAALCAAILRAKAYD